MDNPDEFENRLKDFIKRSGRSQAKTAKMLGYHPSTLSKWLQGINQIPFDALQNLCELVEVSETERNDLFRLAGYDVSSLLRPSEQLPLIRELVLANTELRTFQKTGFETSVIELFIQDLSEPTYLRLTALKAYIMDGLSNQAMFNTLITDPDPTIRQAMLRHVYRNPNPNNEIQFHTKYLERLIHDEVLDVAVEAIKAARHLISNSKIPLKLLTAAKYHRYWLVRKIAIRHIASIDTLDVLELLYEFRTTSYYSVT